MFEGKRVVAGEAILSGVTTINGSADSSDSDRVDATLESLVRQHSRMVYRITFAVLRRHHDAEDATQETFLRVLRYSAKLASVDDPKTWLARIAWRVAVDRSRHRKSKGEVPLDDPEQPQLEIPDAGAPADDSMQGAQIARTVEKMMAALPAKLREPLILSTVEEMSPKEVAATLGINEAAVRSRVFRARQILKEKLSQTLSRK